MAKEVDEFVRTCDICQHIKPPKQYNRAELIPIQSSKPFEIITTDLMGELPLTENGNKYIMVVCDHFTKYVEIFPLKSATAQDVAECLMEYICRHSVPETILSDQGTCYLSNLVFELLEVLDVRRAKTTPFHPMCDGLTERQNRTIKAMLQAYIDSARTKWDKALKFIQFAYNSAVNTTTKCTPFELVYGRKPKIPIDLLYEGVEVDLHLTHEEYASTVNN